MSDYQEELKFTEFIAVKGSKTIDHELPKDMHINPYDVVKCTHCNEIYCACKTCNERDKDIHIGSLCIECSKKVQFTHDKKKEEVTF